MLIVFFAVGNRKKIQHVYNLRSYKYSVHLRWTFSILQCKFNILSAWNQSKGQHSRKIFRHWPVLQVSFKMVDMKCGLCVHDDAEEYMHACKTASSVNSSYHTKMKFGYSWMRVCHQMFRDWIEHLIWNMKETLPGWILIISFFPCTRTKPGERHLQGLDRGWLASVHRGDVTGKPTTEPCCSSWRMNSPGS